MRYTLLFMFSNHLFAYNMIWISVFLKCESAKAVLLTEILLISFTQLPIIDLWQSVKHVLYFVVIRRTSIISPYLCPLCTQLYFTCISSSQRPLSLFTFAFGAHLEFFIYVILGVSCTTSGARRQLRVAAAAAGRRRTIHAAVPAAEQFSCASTRWRQRRRSFCAPCGQTTRSGRPRGRARSRSWRLRRRPFVRDESAQKGISYPLAQRRAAHEDGARHSPAHSGVCRLSAVHLNCSILSTHLHL